ncbi:MAG: SPFH domain-containing protein [Fimbriiglobus sp.]|jgi:membrane protease subunit HflK|nr:SPFH domain-containing protein [Fimbriiglobus sp.]
MLRRFRYMVPIVLVAYLLTGVSQVEPDERAVVRRFGQVIDRPGPGLRIGLPWGIDRVDKFKVRTVQLTVGYNPDETADSPGIPAGQFVTGDQNLINLRMVVAYEIDTRDGELENYAAHRDRVDAVLARESEAVASEWTAACTVDEVLSGRAMIARRVTERLPQRIAPHRLGVVVQRVSVEHLAAPDEVKDSFDAVNQAQTGIRTRVNTAEQDAQRRVSEADALRQKLQSEASAYANERETLARADAAAFTARLNTYRTLKATNPDVLSALWREEVSRILVGVKERGRVEVLDDVLGPNGLELNQFLPTRK